MLPLILGSSSPYRKEVLEKLNIPFKCHSPNINENARTHEPAKELVLRLALEKARAIATQHPNALIIGSDQIATLGDETLGKPHTHAKATAQLRACSGKKVTFLTSLCLLNSETLQHQLSLTPYHVEFLSLSEQQIHAYLLKEKPYNCAGSFKSEGLGITLFKRLEGEDPNSLIGLPLISLTSMLRNEGIEPLQY